MPSSHLVVNSGYNRKNNDFYETPRHCVTSLLKSSEIEQIKNHSIIWEPFCGEGAITNVLEEKINVKIYKTDNIKRINDIDEVRDFFDFKSNEIKNNVCIITNPPFKYADKIINKAKELNINYMALLLKSDFFSTKSRKYHFEGKGWKPSKILPLTKRADFTGQGKPTMTVSWYIWEGNSLYTVFEPLD